MTDKILFVDDDPNILSAFKRQLHKKFNLATATSGEQALELLEREGPFAVVISDMRMPEMDGIEFLTHVQQQSPESVRMMITGNADQQTAIDAVNKGNVFRFITKPASLQLLTGSLSAALEQYRLLQAEKELLQGTLNGSVRLLVDLLGITVPEISSEDMDLRLIAVEIARQMDLPNPWELEIATMLSHIAHMTLPRELLDKLAANEDLSEEEKAVIEHLPETGNKLLANIPRLEHVAKIILYQNKNFDGSGFPVDHVSGKDIPLGSRILKVLHDMKSLQHEKDISAKQAAEMLRDENDHYDPLVLQTTSYVLSSFYVEKEDSPPQEIFINELRAGMLLEQDIVTQNGQTLLCTGQSLTDALVERLSHYHKIEQIKEPLLVSKRG